MKLIEPCCAERQMRQLRNAIGKNGTRQFEGYGDLSLTELLPALPNAWKAGGSVSGLCLRGGFMADFSWKDGQLTSLTITSRRPDKGTLKIECGGKKWSVSLKPGEWKMLEGSPEIMKLVNKRTR